MGADILDGLERFANGGYGDWSTVASKAIARIQLDAAEIGRLRGELAVANECLGEERAANVLRTPAPAMPNGVEVAEIVRMLCAYSGTTTAHVMGDSKKAGDLAEAMSRAADNRDAAGVAEEYDEGPTWTHDGKRISAVFSGDGKVGLVITANPGAVNGRIEFIGAPVPIPPTPAAVPAGEAVAEIVMCEGIGGHTVLKWRDGLVPFLMAHRIGTKLYTTPPAPVQAAPQEGDDHG